MARRLLTDRRGSAALEFAFVGPALILLALVIVEVMMLRSGAMALEAGARAAARYGLTGAMTAAKTRPEVLRTIITEYVCPRALSHGSVGHCFWATGGPVSVDESGRRTPLFMATRAYTDPRNFGVGEPFADSQPFNGRRDAGETYTDLNGNGAYDADTGSADAGGPNDFVVYRVGIWQAVKNPLIRAAVGGPFLYNEARIVVRNEPY